MTIAVAVTALVVLGSTDVMRRVPDTPKAPPTTLRAEDPSTPPACRDALESLDNLRAHPPAAVRPSGTALPGPSPEFLAAAKRVQEVCDQ